MYKLLIFIFFLIIAFSSEAQNTFVGKALKTNVLVGDKEPFTTKEDIQFSPLNEVDPWGNFVTFNVDGTFSAYNQVSCGLDCRKKIKGRYTINGSELTITVDEIKYYDICATRTAVTRSFTYGTFKILLEDGAVVLKK